MSWEVEALQLARGHRRLLQLLDVFETSTELAIVLELVQGGELFDYLATKDTFTEEEAVLFTRQLLHGLDYLYNRKVAHLDIKVILINRHWKVSDAVYVNSQRILFSWKRAEWILSSSSTLD